MLVAFPSAFAAGAAHPGGGWDAAHLPTHGASRPLHQPAGSLTTGASHARSGSERITIQNSQIRSLAAGICAPSHPRVYWSHEGLRQKDHGLPRTPRALPPEPLLLTHLSLAWGWPMNLQMQRPHRAHCRHHRFALEAPEAIQAALHI